MVVLMLIFHILYTCEYTSVFAHRVKYRVPHRCVA